MSYREISAWVVLLLTFWLFADFAPPLIEARSLAGDQNILRAVVLFVSVLVGAHILVAVLLRGRTDDGDERDRHIELRAESIGGFVLGAAVIYGIVATLMAGDYASANFMFLALICAEITKRVWQIVLYRRAA